MAKDPRSKHRDQEVKKWQIIDLVRSVCVIAAMSVHIYTNVPFNNPVVCWLWGRFCTNGIYGVFLFFIVSGFLITHVIASNTGNLFKPDLFRFYIQRIGRIWPLFFLCFISGLVIFLYLPKNSPFYIDYFAPLGKYDFWFWFSLPTFLFNWLLVLRPSWNYSFHWMLFWSLAIEEQFYLFYPLALRKIKNKKKLFFCLGLTIFIAIGWRILFHFFRGHNDFIQSYASLAKFDLIALGILLYLAIQKYGPFLSKHKKTSIFLCTTGLTILILTYFGSRENDSFDEIFVPEAFGLGLGGFLLGGLYLPLFESKYLSIPSLPGKYCYGCYLLHPTLLLFIHPFIDKVNIFLSFFLFIIMITLVAAVSYHFFELPANRLVRRILE
jgi:peptidoglycan/LPS O-acetylase OafA/YrhL